ncbi:hypothetical protein ACFSHQ_17005 [Gemmobacter lanyuensis]
MAVAALPYIRYVQMVTGRSDALWRDPQVRSYVIWMATAVGVVTLWRVLTSSGPIEPIFRETLFNMISIMTGTGYFSGSFTAWGGFVLVAAFFVGVIGGVRGQARAR